MDNAKLKKLEKSGYLTINHFKKLEQVLEQSTTKQLEEMFQQRDLHGIIGYMTDCGLPKQEFNRYIWALIERMNRDEHQREFNNELNKVLKD